MNGKKVGRGKFIWADGSVYEGDFLDNNLHGKGVYNWIEKKVYDEECINN